MCVRVIYVYGTRVSMCVCERVPKSREDQGSEHALSAACFIYVRLHLETRGKKKDEGNAFYTPKQRHLAGVFMAKPSRITHTFLKFWKASISIPMQHFDFKFSVICYSTSQIHSKVASLNLLLIVM